MQESRRLLAFENLDEKFLSTTTIVRFVILQAGVLRAAVHTTLDFVITLLILGSIQID